MIYLLNLTLRLSLVFCLVVSSLVAIGCGESEVQKNITRLKTNLNNTAKTLNTIAKSNRTLYTQQIIDLDTRIKVATYVHGANEYLITAIGIAKTITPETFAGSKSQILSLLNQSLAEMRKVSIGKPAIDLAIQTAIGFMNTAIALTQAFSGWMLKTAAPEFRIFSDEPFLETRRYLEGVS